MHDNTTKPAGAMRSPTPVVIEVHADSTAVPQAPGCCSCVPPGASADVQAVHCNSVAILVIHIIAAIVLSNMLYAQDRSTLYGLAVFPGIIMSGIVLCGSCKSKFFYAFCGFPYLLVGIVDVILCVVWYSDPYFPGDLHDLVGLVPVTGAIFTLLGSAMAFKTAFMWDKAGAVPEASAVTATQAITV